LQTICNKSTKTDPVKRKGYTKFDANAFFRGTELGCILALLYRPNVWLAAVPPCVGFAGYLFGGMDSKPLFDVLFVFIIF